LLVLAAFALLAPALFNGFPLVFADTGGYLARPFERTLEIGRSALYGAFMAAGLPLHFWPAVLAQAALTVWLIALTLRSHGLGGRPGLVLLMVLALALLTGLPWYVGQLIPDIFVPLAVLALYLLAFRWMTLRRFERGLLVALVALAIAFHMSILGLAAALVLALVLIRPAASRLRLPRPALLPPLAAVCAGIVLALVSNLAITGSFAFTPGGANFIFGRLLQDGIVERYLADRCPDPTIRLCEYRHELPANADGWLWGWGSPYYKLGGSAGFEPDARRIIAETLRLYPGAHVTTAAKAMLDQLVMMKTGEGMHSRDNEHAARDLARLAPAAYARFEASRQQHDWFTFDALNAVQVPLALAAFAALPLIVLLAGRGRLAPAMAPLALTVLLALLANAGISGGLSNPNDRYQNRLAWLAPFTLMIALAGSLRRRPDQDPQTAVKRPSD
jgi:hypothetical protein